MAKKEKKGNKKASAGNPADALRDAVERTFQGAAGGASGAQKRVQEVFDDFGTALTRLRETIDEKRVVETLEHLRDQVEGLGKRVSDLESSVTARVRGEAPKPARSTSTATPAASASSATASKPAARKPAARKPAARKPAARKPAARKKPAAAAAKPGAAAARKPAARKPAAKPASTTRRASSARTAPKPKPGSSAS